MMEETAKAEALFGDTMRSAEEAANGITSAKKTVTVANKDYVSPFESHADTRDKASTQAQDMDARDRNLANANVSEAVNEIVESMGMEANEVTGQFSDFLGKHGLDANVAKELLSMHQKQIETMQQAYQDHWEQQTSDWHDQTTSELSSYEIGNARNLVRQYGDDELREFLDNSGVGNHPAVVRFISKIARALS